MNNNSNYISARKLDYYVNNPNSIIIDLRDNDDYHKSHIKNAINIPYDKMKEMIKEIMNMNTSFYRKRSRCIRWDDKIYCSNYIFVFYCERGATSMKVCMQMSGLGFISKSLIGGFRNYEGKNIE